MTPADLSAGLNDREYQSRVVQVGGAQGRVQEDLFFTSKRTKESDNTFDVLPSPVTHGPHLE